MIARCLCLVLVASAVAATVSAQGGGQGYLVTFYVEGNDCRFSASALVENYVKSKHVTEADDWTVCLENEAGDLIWQAALDNPFLYSPMLHVRQPIPFTVKIPRLGAHTLTLRDQNGAIRLRHPLDQRFIEEAAANRARFLEADRQNRDAILRLRQEGAGGSGNGNDPTALRPAEEAPEPGDWLYEHELPELMERLTEGDSLEVLRPRDPPIQSPRVGWQQATSWTVSGIVRNAAGNPVQGASLLLRNLVLTAPTGLYWQKSTSLTGQYSFSVPSNVCPSSFALYMGAAGYAKEAVMILVDGNVVRDLVLSKRNTVSGTVKDTSGKAVSGTRVRAYQGGAFVDSALTKSDGTYSLELGTGTYDFTAASNADTTIVTASQPAVNVSEARVLDFTLERRSNTFTVRLLYPDDKSYFLTQPAPKRFEIEQNGRLLQATIAGKATLGFDSVKGRYFASYSLYLDPGQYSLTCYPLGHAPVRIRNFQVGTQTTLDVDLGPAITWKGVLWSASGTPLPNADIRSYDDLVMYSVATRTDSAGRFTVPMTPGGLLKFYADSGSRNTLYVEKIDALVENRVVDCVLGEYPPYADYGSVLTQIYGTSDRTNRQNIVMIGNGYTSVRETFTDQNQNGRWDGYVFYDLNKDGVWNTGEPYRGYGNRTTAPVSGTNPTVDNEPFEDLNQDGIPNLDDQALFDQNTLDVARSILGQDFWSEHKNALNIFRIRVISNQAGHDVRDKDGKNVIVKDTALGSFLSDPDRNYILNADATLVAQYLNQYVPEWNIRIVFINQPIPMGRATSFILQQGGAVTDLQNRVTIAHEMGHTPGRLADEYTEFESYYTGIEPARPNVTTETNPDLVPWRAFLTPGKEIPSVPGSCGVGLFEGSMYYTGGCYRPTVNCLMVSGNRFCPVCRQALEIRMARLTGSLPAPVPLGPEGVVSTLRPVFQWEMQPGISHLYVEVQRVDQPGESQIRDVYGSWFEQPTALTPGVLYRWRLRPAAEDLQGVYSDWIYFQPKRRRTR